MANLKKMWIIPIVFYYNAFCSTPTTVQASYLNNDNDNERCRCFPGDSCWPSELSWQALNNSVHGRLVATIPLGAPCHDGPIYNADICKNFQNHWLEPVTQLVKTKTNPSHEI